MRLSYNAGWSAWSSSSRRARRTTRMVIGIEAGIRFTLFGFLKIGVSASMDVPCRRRSSGARRADRRDPAGDAVVPARRDVAAGLPVRRAAPGAALDRGSAAAQRGRARAGDTGPAADAPRALRPVVERRGRRARAQRSASCARPRGRRRSGSRTSRRTPRCGRSRRTRRSPSRGPSRSTTSSASAAASPTGAATRNPATCR